jgi:hypothetical protein
VKKSDFQRGAEAAASWADEYNGSTTHEYRLGDCILGKMNLRKERPRRNRRKLDGENRVFIQGFAMALAEMHRRLLGGNDSTGVREVARAAGITISSCKKFGVAPYDWRELRRAGVKS